MKLNNLKIGTKMYSGFIMSVLLMLVVGVIAYNGISKIVYQLEISKVVNRIIVDGGDVQSNSLRYIIYGEEKYYSAVEMEANNVIIQSDKVKELLLSTKNKKVAEEIKEAMVAYETANFDYYNLDGIKLGVHAKRQEAALNATNQIIGVIDAATLYSRQNKNDYSAVERVFMVQDARNSMNRVRITANKYVANPSLELERTLKAELQDINELLNDAHKLMASDVTKKAIDQALVALNQYEEEFQNYKQIVEQQIDIQKQQRESSSILLDKARDLRQGVYDYVDNTQKASYSMLIVILLIAAMLSMIIGTLITRNITGPLAKGVQFANSISKGDLTQQLDVNRKDEIGKLAGALKNMSEKIKQVVIEITTGADNITSASQQISSSSQHLSQGANEQAASVEEVSSTMEQIVSNVQQNTDNAQQTEKIALLAQEGMRDVSKRSNETMEANKLIAQKIDIINDIAFQTNILALNAAVEAARAGEQGKGFAVVAAEVRKLAERSKIAAEEIVGLTHNSLKFAEGAGKKLEEIMPEVENTTSLVQEIAAAGIEQNNGAAQVNNAVQQLNNVTQQNASSSEELSTSAEEMANQSEQLKLLIAFFKVDNSNGLSRASNSNKIENNHKNTVELPKKEVNEDKIDVILTGDNNDFESF